MTNLDIASENEWRNNYRLKASRLKTRYVNLSKAMHRRMSHWERNSPRGVVLCTNPICIIDVCQYARAMARVSRVAGLL